MVRRALFWTLLIVLAVHARSLGGAALVYDDGAHVFNNPLFLPPGWHALERVWSAPFEGLFAPVAYTLWWLLAKLSYLLFGELRPVLFHGANWLLHAGVSACVFQLCARRGAGPLGAALGALCFGLHPLCVESVAWISELRGLLAALLGLLAILSLPRAWLATLLFALALLSKPAAVAVLPMAWLLDPRPWREKWRLHVGWSVMVLALVWISTQAQSGEALRVATTPAERVWIAIDALASYTRAWLMPVDLCVDAGRSPQFVLAERSWLFRGAMQSLFLGLLLVVWGLWWRRCGARDPLLSLCALAPVLGLIPFAFQNTSTVADRYAYLALLGPALSVARWQGTLRRAAWLVPAGVVAVYALLWMPLSVRQQGFWASDTALFERALAVNPRSAVAHSNLGLVALREGRLADARAQYEQALVLRPEDARARANLGLCLFQSGQVQAGLSELRAALALAPDYLRARANLVRGLMQTGETASAREQAEELVQRHPDSAEAWTLHGQVALAGGERAQARASALRALELLPGYAPARALLGEDGEPAR